MVLQGEGWQGDGKEEVGDGGRDSGLMKGGGDVWGAEEGAWGMKKEGRDMVMDVGDGEGYPGDGGGRG